MQIVWHRTELRTHDHPALNAALEAGGPVVPLVIVDPIIFDRPATTPRRQAWFLANVAVLRESYRALGSDLIVREGVPHEVFAELARELKPTAVRYVANHTPYAKRRDAAVAEVLGAAGVAHESYPGQYTHPPGEVLTNTGGPYGVFGPYARKWRSLPLPALAPTPDAVPPVPKSISRGKLRRVESDIPLPPAGEHAAYEQLQRFLEVGEADYDISRNFPARRPSTSLLSMYFNIGALSPRLAYQMSKTPKWGSELAWWDFNAEVLDRQPEGATEEYKQAWRDFPWRRDADEERLWAEGKTGYPLVDAGMRQLRATGFMHNRVRMVTASFLTKHLLIDWRAGEAVFRGLLLCGDSAQNIGNWQWVAGCGYDAAPYFRIMNPVAQSEKFDPAGDYIREWVPELAKLSARAIHRPWLIDNPSRDYPPPMIDLGVGRDRFLAAAQAHLKRKPQG